MWDANPQPSIAGYRVYYGTAPSAYTHMLDVGNTTMAQVSNLTGGTVYFFAATAYNMGGMESTYSNEVTFTAPVQSPTPTQTPVATPTATATSTATPTSTSTPVHTPTPTPSPTATAVHSPTPTPVPTPVQSPTPTPAPIAVTPAVLNFNAVAGGSPPPSQSIRITTSNGRPWKATENASWFGVAPTRGASGTSIIVTPSIQGLAIGTYSKTITFTAPSLPNTVVTVNLNVTSVPIPTPSPSPALPPWFTPTPSPTPARGLANVSTRLFVQTGNSVMIGGFIVAGEAAKKVILRGIGPSLAAAGVAVAMNDPVLNLYDSTGSVIASNDNWRSEQSQLIEELGLAPADDREAALVTTLSPGAYTAVVSDANDVPGVGSFEFYDLEPFSSELTNLSTRGRVETGDRVMIGGFIVSGDEPTMVIVRAIGPSLAPLGIPDALVDPILELHDANGSLIVENDNWRTDQEEDILDSALAPTDERESAVVAALPPGSYTGVIRGAGETTGVALFEIYRLLP